MHESAGKSWSRGSRKGNKWLCAALVEAAGSASRMKRNYLGAQYRHLAPRRGAKRTIVAVAHSMLVVVYYMLTRDEPYRDLDADYFTRPVDPQIATRRLVAQLERLGHTVTLEQASCSTPGHTGGVTDKNESGLRPDAAARLARVQFTGQ